ncbi:hypothetical protein HQ496_08275 [bacterium]|nr:hypothetical protein [bacterium]
MQNKAGLIVLIGLFLTLSGCAGVAKFLSELEDSDPEGVFSSTGAVWAYAPIFPSTKYVPWTGGCSIDPDVDLKAFRDAPTKATRHGKKAHEWQEYAKTQGFTAEWITSQAELESPGPEGQNFSRFSTSVSGKGEYDLQLLADDCAWAYLDGQRVALQGTQKTYSDSYPVRLNGTHKLDVIVYDGGGIGGLMFSLDTRPREARQATQN